MKILSICLLLTVILLVSCTKTIDLKEGDIVFQESLSSQSKAIQLATKSKYSHMGIVLKKDGKLSVYEAGEIIKYAPLREWVRKGKDGKYVAKRLKNSEQILTEEAIKQMRKSSEKYIGKKYDLYFEWSDDKIYCSELVWKIYKDALAMEIGKLQIFSEFDLNNAVVKSKLKERFGSKIPTNEPVISPASMFDSDKLITVYSDYSE
ncbi:MAG: hypothetical protein A2231_00115 [Candidatus Firestonebacteria bacterium RIFOXYA2_FULL_40_8]|nr:MAG: hypothetical protein A2231_00115 [Candidatus Firestonebacteria bacterium RIFOXYA2_FULL_40_8]